MKNKTTNPTRRSNKLNTPNSNNTLNTPCTSNNDLPLWLSKHTLASRPSSTSISTNSTNGNPTSCLQGSSPM